MDKQNLINKLDDIYNEVIKYYPNDTSLEDDVKEILMIIDELQQKIHWNL
jgi:peptidoglycan hydrolase CwlO-like protein